MNRIGMSQEKQRELLVKTWELEEATNQSPIGLDILYQAFWETFDQKGEFWFGDVEDTYECWQILLEHLLKLQNGRNETQHD